MAAKSASSALAAGLGTLALDPDLAEPLIAYRDLLARWNRVYNLSAVRDAKAMVPRHLLDSLAVLPHLPAGPLLDVGTGPGLPGIPIAIAQPSRPVTLLEANGKKARFLRQARLELGLENVEIAEVRLEHYQSEAGFAVIICRAFSEALAFWQGVAPLLADDGLAIAMKGRRDEAELAALTKAGVSWQAQDLTVPGLEAERHLLLLKGAASATGQSS